MLSRTKRKKGHEDPEVTTSIFMTSIFMTSGSISNDAEPPAASLWRCTCAALFSFRAVAGAVACPPETLLEKKTKKRKRNLERARVSDAF